MIPLNELALFMLAALGMVLTPGPNMMYLVSRSICQGRVAGLISLAGVVIGFLFYMLSAVLGMTAILFAVPFAYTALTVVTNCMQRSSSISPDLSALCIQSVALARR